MINRQNIYIREIFWFVVAIWRYIIAMRIALSIDILGVGYV